MEPITRSEQYLASIIGEDVVLPVPQSRIEHYLNLIAQNGISPSSAGLISYDPDADYPDGSLGAGMKAEAAEVDDLKSAIGENGANILSAYPTDTASGAIASFPDGAAVPVKSLTVAITPAQDLHGQSYPYPAGGGPNKLSPAPSESKSSAYITVVSDGNGSYSVSGTASSSATIIFTPSVAYTIQSGDYVHCLNSVVNGSVVFRIDFTDSSHADSGLTVANRIDSLESYVGKTVSAIRFYVASGATYSGTLKPMIVNSSSAMSFAPYSNICPISGWTQAKVTRTGKNLFHNTATTQTINGVTFTVNSDGTVSTSGTATANAALTLGSIMLKKGVSYILNGCPSGGSTSRYLVSFSGIGFDSGSGYSYTPANDTTAYVVITAFAGTNVTGMTFKPMVRFAFVSDADYNPYVEPQTLLISWQSEAGTVYGGTLDVLTGVLTVTHGIVDLGTLANWYASATDQSGEYRFSAILDEAVSASASSAVPPGVCSQYPAESADNTYLRQTGFSIYKGSNPNTRVYIYDPAYSTGTATAFAAAMSGVQLCYELATPQTVQLTPTEVSTLLGANNIWADTGDITVNYRADPTLYIEKLTGSTEEDMIADAPIASGKYFLVGNRLFLSTASIAAGATLTPGTNCTETNLAAALNALNS